VVDIPEGFVVAGKNIQGLTLSEALKKNLE
jgi:hypothetical protein